MKSHNSPHATRLVAILLVIALLIAAAVPTAFAGGGTTGYVGTAGLNVRPTASTSGVRVGVLVCGTAVTYDPATLTSADGHMWANGTFAGVTGYVATNLLRSTMPNCTAASGVRSLTGTPSATIPTGFSDPYGYGNFAVEDAYLDTVTNVGTMVVDAPVSVKVWVNVDTYFQANAVTNTLGVNVYPKHVLLRGGYIHSIRLNVGNNVFWEYYLSNASTAPTSNGCENAPAGYVTPDGWSVKLCVDPVTAAGAAGQEVGVSYVPAGTVIGTYFDSSACTQNGADLDGYWPHVNRNVVATVQADVNWTYNVGGTPGTLQRVEFGGLNINGCAP